MPITDEQSAQAQRAVDSWNRTMKVGSKVFYRKSDIEGLVVLKTADKAEVFGGEAAVQLEHIGLALLSKTEPYFD